MKDEWVFKTEEDLIQFKNWHPQFGDRMQEIVLIGQNMVLELEAQFDYCIWEDELIRRPLGSIDDPFPSEESLAEDEATIIPSDIPQT